MNRSLSHVLWASCLLSIGASGGAASLPGHAYPGLDGAGQWHGSAFDPEDSHMTGARLVSIDLAPQAPESGDLDSGENPFSRGDPFGRPAWNPSDGGWLSNDARAPLAIDPSGLFRPDSLSLVEAVTAPSDEAQGGVGVGGATPIGYPIEGVELNNVPVAYAGGYGPDWLPTHVTIGSVTIRFFHRHPSTFVDASRERETGRLAASQAGLIAPLALGALGLLLAIWGFARRGR